MKQFCFVIFLAAFLFSCQKEKPRITPTLLPPLTDTTKPKPSFNQSLITGWWKNTKDLYTAGSLTYFDVKLRYFGADSFYYHDLTNVLQESATGKWWWVGKDSFYIQITGGWGQGLYKHKVTDLVSHLMLHQLYNDFVYGSLKHDSAAIVSKPIATIAGTGENGNEGDAGPAKKAQLTIVYDIVVDKEGNLFLSDGFKRIRKINATDGKISPYAGNGGTGHSGDGGLALNASMEPGSLAADRAGNVYFTDNQMNCIRKISVADHTISTIAGKPSVVGGFNGDGGLAVNALLNAPNSIFVDAMGDVYFMDLGNTRIRKIKASDGTIHTVAGNGNWGAISEGSLATGTTINTTTFTIDRQGNFYLMGNEVQKIYKIDAATGIINALIGTGTKGYNGEGITALHTQLGYPVDIATDGEGSVYFSEKQEGPRNYIRKFSKRDGKVYTVAGNGLPKYTGDGKLATAYGIGGYLNICMDQNDNLLINDSYRIRRLTTK